MYSKTILQFLCVGLVAWVGLPAAQGQSLWGHYPVGENDFRDDSGNERHGIPLDGAVTTFDSERGWVADFTQNASGSPRIQLNADDPAGADKLSISAWVRWLGPDGRRQGIAGKSLTASDRAWVLQLGDADGAIHWPNDPTSVILDRDTWLHVVATYDGSASRLYVNGEQVYGPSFGSLPRTGNWAAAHVTLGHAEDRDDRPLWFNGYLDDVYIFSKTLSNSQVQGLLQGIAPSFLNAHEPQPPDGATCVMAGLLSWTPGDTAMWHDVYIGTHPDLGPADLRISHSTDTHYWLTPGPQPEMTYYWRVDEIEADNETTHTGDVWSFSTICVKAGRWVPPDGAGDVCLNVILSWPPVEGAALYHLYFGDDLAAVLTGMPETDMGTTPETMFRPRILEYGTTYYWRVDVMTADNTVLPGSVRSFTTQAAPLDGVVREWWLNIPGTRVSNLTGNPDFPSSPDGWECLDCLRGPTNWADNYGSRLYGLLLPPVSGTYTFRIDSKDESQLWLSSDANPANLQLIASVSGIADFAWSQPLMLQAGKQHHIEAWMKAGVGRDSISVSWRRPGMIVPEIICRPFLQNLACEPLQANCPDPQDGELNAAQVPVLSWCPGRNALQHDVYFSDRYEWVANADTSTLGVYKGQQLGTTYRPGELEEGRTYYWRIDEVNPNDPASPWKGCVWSFRTSRCAIVFDDFESYTDEALNEIWQTWHDGRRNGTGSRVGHPNPPYAEQTIVHGGNQSMPMYYDNTIPPRFISEADRSVSITLEAITEGVTMLTLWVHGRPPTSLEPSAGNDPCPLYLRLEDNTGRSVTVNHPDGPSAVLVDEWRLWAIPLSEFQTLNPVGLRRFVIGVGDPTNPAPNGTGLIYIDDICLR